MTFLGTVIDCASLDYAGMLPEQPASGSVIQVGDCTSPQDISEDARPDGGCLLSYSPGPATHAAPSVLACLAPGLLLYQGNPSLCQSCGPLDNFSPVSIRRTFGNDLQEEGSHDRRLQLRLNSLCIIQYIVIFLHNILFCIISNILLCHLIY